MHTEFRPLIPEIMDSLIQLVEQKGLLFRVISKELKLPEPLIECVSIGYYYAL